MDQIQHLVAYHSLYKLLQLAVGLYVHLLLPHVRCKVQNGMKNTKQRVSWRLQINSHEWESNINKYITLTCTTVSKHFSYYGHCDL